MAGFVEDCDSFVCDLTLESSDIEFDVKPTISDCECCDQKAELPDTSYDFES